MIEEPYLKRYRMELYWNPSYDQEAICVCGHPYYRHFDSYDHMYNIGCKYCECGSFTKEIGKDGNV